MTLIDPLNPATAFFIYLCLGGLVYLAGRILAPAVRDTGGKLLPYACGEEAPLQKLRPNYNFYHFAYLFAILHIGTMVACTAFLIISYALPLLYLSLVLFGVSILVAR